jgi:hypothetical protein
VNCGLLIHQIGIGAIDSYLWHMLKDGSDSSNPHNKKYLEKAIGM